MIQHKEAVEDTKCGLKTIIWYKPFLALQSNQVSLLSGNGGED
jgi:hypothetical protein